MKKIMIDPGHGGTDGGAVNGKRYEKDDNLRLAKAVRDLLSAQGHTVLMTREEDEYVSLTDRTNAANKASADIFVSLHRNSFTNNTAKGIEIWVYTIPTAGELGAAYEVLEELAKVANQANRGVKKGNYHVCRETNMPAILIELGFISNSKDNELYDRYYNDNATAIARGILTALGEDWKSPAEPAKPLYRVQIGAFSVKENAEAFLQTVRNMGLPAFIVAPDTPTIEEK